MALSGLKPRTRGLILTLGISALAVAVIAPGASATPRTKLVSRDNSGVQADSASRPSASADGKIAGFHTVDDLQNPPDDDAVTDAYLRNIALRKTRLLSRGVAGVTGNDDSRFVSVSGTGRYFAFVSTATNLVGTPVNGDEQVYVRDHAAGTTTLASANNAGQAADSQCFGADISANGKLVVFYCSGSTTNMYPGDAANGNGQVFLRNVVIGRTTLISRNRAGVAGDGHSSDPAISPDGGSIVFESIAGNLKGVSNGHSQVFLLDRKAGKLRLISRKPNGPLGNGSSGDADVSAWGRVVVYESGATNLAGADTNGKIDILRFRRHVGPRGKTDRVSLNWKNRQLINGHADDPSISRSGRHVAYESRATNAIRGGIRGDIANIYRRDMVQRTQKLVSRTGNRKANGSVDNPYITDNGKFVFFSSRADNLIPGGDANGTDPDVLRRGPY